MINRRNYKNFCVLLALTSISCSDSEGWMSSIPLSNEKISFTASLQEGWSGGQGSGDKSRAVKPDFPGLAREQKVLTTDEAFSKPLYLHPIETVNKTLKNQGPTTRGIMNNSRVVDNFGVSANYIQNGISEEQSFFQNKEAKKEGSNWFVADNTKWPAAGTVSFYAYAPYNDASFTLNNNKTIHYTVPTNVEKQPDFIVANSEGKSFSSSSANTPVDLHFRHALTAITFSVSDDMEKGVINSIKIEGVKGEGDYNLSTNAWSVSSSSASYNVPISAGGLSVGTGTVNLAANATLMMIPQTLVDGAKVTINITPTGKKSAVDLTFDLKDTQWVAGNHVTYLFSTTKIIKLNMGSVTYPQWQTAEGSAFTSEKLKSSYANGDALGMYIVDKNHKVVKANVQLTTTDGNNWNFSSSQKFNGSLSYDYFLYYPYQADGLAGAPKVGEAVSVNSGTNQISASDFFSGAITEWGKKFDTSSGKTIDQSDIKKMNSFDLQIGKADVLGESGTVINFSSMTHAMGLAEIVLGKTSSTNCICYLEGYKEYPTWNGTITSYPSSSIKNHTMYGIADHRYVCIVKPGENSFMSATVKDAWKEEVKLSPAANEVKSGTAYCSIDPTTRHPYTLAVGDIYYSDGALSHQEDDLLKSTSERIPIGIVGYITMDGHGNYWTEKDTKEIGIGGHALVMCLKTVGSTGGNDKGTDYAWHSSNSYPKRTNVTSKSLLVDSYKETYGSGYTETAALIGASPAAAAANDYKTLPAKSSKCTGWFLPSAGQFYAVLTTLGAPLSDNWEINAYIDNISLSIGNINRKLDKLDETKYTDLFDMGQRSAWTSSEYSSESAISFDESFDYVGEGTWASVYFFCGTDWTKMKGVRPFLAF